MTEIVILVNSFMGVNQGGPGYGEIYQCLLFIHALQLH